MVKIRIIKPGQVKDELVKHLQEEYKVDIVYCADFIEEAKNPPFLQCPVMELGSIKDREVILELSAKGQIRLNHQLINILPMEPDNECASEGGLQPIFYPQCRTQIDLRQKLSSHLPTPTVHQRREYQQEPVDYQPLPRVVDPIEMFAGANTVRGNVPQSAAYNVKIQQRLKAMMSAVRVPREMCLKVKVLIYGQFLNKSLIYVDRLYVLGILVSKNLTKALFLLLCSIVAVRIMWSHSTDLQQSQPIFAKLWGAEVPDEYKCDEWEKSERRYQCNLVRRTNHMDNPWFAPQDHLVDKGAYTLNERETKGGLQTASRWGGSFKLPQASRVSCNMCRLRKNQGTMLSMANISGGTCQFFVCPECAGTRLLRRDVARQPVQWRNDLCSGAAKIGATFFDRDHDQKQKWILEYSSDCDSTDYIHLEPEPVWIDDQLIRSRYIIILESELAHQLPDLFPVLKARFKELYAHTRWYQCDEMAIDLPYYARLFKERMDEVDASREFDPVFYESTIEPLLKSMIAANGMSFDLKWSRIANTQCTGWVIYQRLLPVLVEAYPPLKALLQSAADETATLENMSMNDPLFHIQNCDRIHVSLSPKRMEENEACPFSKNHSDHSGVEKYVTESVGTSSLEDTESASNAEKKAMYTVKWRDQDNGTFWSHWMWSDGHSYKSKYVCYAALQGIQQSPFYQSFFDLHRSQLQKALALKSDVMEELRAGTRTIHCTDRTSQYILKSKKKECSPIVVQSKFEVISIDDGCAMESYCPQMTAFMKVLKFAHAFGAWVTGCVLPEYRGLSVAVEEYGFSGRFLDQTDCSIYRDHLVSAHWDDNRLIEESVPFWMQFYAVSKAFPLKDHSKVILCDYGTKHGCAVQGSMPCDELHPWVDHHAELDGGDLYIMPPMTIHGGPQHGVHGNQEPPKSKRPRETFLPAMEGKTLTFVMRFKTNRKLQSDSDSESDTHSVQV